MSHTIMRMLALIATVAAVCGCQKTDQAPLDPVPGFEAILNSQDAARITQWFTDDAAMLPENQRRVSGKDDLLQYFKDLASADLTYRVEATGLTTDHKLAVSEGTYSVLNLKTQQEVERGKYLAVLRHVEQGWRVHRLMTNSDVAPPKTTVIVEQDAAKPKS